MTVRIGNPGAALCAAADLLDPHKVARSLRSVIPIDWSTAGGPEDVRVERCWPMGDDGLLIEWSFVTADRRRHTLYGIQSDKEIAVSDSSTAPSARLTRDGLDGVRIDIPAWQVRIHSVDADPRLPQLTTCLDPSAISERLCAVGLGPYANGRPSSRIDRCHLLGYRAGRRAAICYQTVTAGALEPTLAGKTYRDDRGRRLLTLHDRLNRELSAHRACRLRVPEPIAYLDDLQLALFAWTQGNDSCDGPLTGAQLDTAIDVMAQLHALSLDGMPAFHADKECTIIRRWHALLSRVDKVYAGMTASLVDRLLAVGAGMPNDADSLVHRDFYQKQLVMTETSTTLLDLDTMALGSPCVDLGNFLAHLFLNMLQSGGSPAEFGGVTRSVIGRYEALAPALERECLNFYLSSSLFRLGAVHAFRAATGRHAAALWHYASTLQNTTETVRKQSVIFDERHSQSRSLESTGRKERS